MSDSVTVPFIVKYQIGGLDEGSGWSVGIYEKNETFFVVDYRQGFTGRLIGHNDGLDAAKQRAQSWAQEKGYAITELA
ncbi:MAG: hypothetical protein J4428_05035 [Candidatus Aenigmarchaeota archaeon]|nr:hypothetical protein [Candidatus Aenigmarchaeota archaeon]